MSHFPAPCLTVTRERRVSERNHPYNCWGRAGTTGVVEEEKRRSRRSTQDGLEVEGRVGMRREGGNG